MISITITGDTPQLLAAHVAWLSDKLGGTDVIAEVIERKQAKKSADKAIDKAKTESIAPTESSAAEPPPAAEVAVSAVPTIAELMALASAKSKIVGAEKVKGVIGACGAKTIKELPESARGELKIALEVLA